MTNTNTAIVRRVIDSHRKFAGDVFRGREEILKHVGPQDRDEVKVQFARMIAESDRPQAIRVMPLHMSERFFTDRIPAGGPADAPLFTAQIKVRETGRIYWVGYVYGIDEIVAPAPVEQAQEAA